MFHVLLYISQSSKYFIDLFSVPVTLTSNNVIREEVKEGDDIKLPCNAPDASEKEWKQVCKIVDFLIQL